MSETLLVITNMPDAVQAEQLAKRLLAQSLVACVNILAPCQSWYVWEGQLTHDTEVPVLLKTTAMAYPTVEAVICALHPYHVPEIIALPIEAGLPAYLSWVQTQVQQRGDDA